MHRAQRVAGWWTSGRAAALPPVGGGGSAACLQSRQGPGTFRHRQRAQLLVKGPGFRADRGWTAGSESRVRKHGAMWCQRPKDELGCVAGPGWVALHRQQERQALVVSIGLYLMLMIVEQKANGKRLSRRTQRRVLLRRDETDGWRASHVRTTRRARIRPRHIAWGVRACDAIGRLRALFGRASGRRRSRRTTEEKNCSTWNVSIGPGAT